MPRRQEPKGPNERKMSAVCSECNGEGVVVNPKLGTLTNPDTGETIGYTHPNMVVCPTCNGVADPTQ